MRYLVCLISLLLSACTTTKLIDHPSVVTVQVPVVQPVPADLVKDCQPAPLQGTTMGAALNRLASVESCLAQIRKEMAGIRSFQSEHQ